MADKSVRGHAAAFITVLIWGTTFISTKILLGVFTPVEILLIRFITGYAALWCVCPHKLKVLDRKQEWYFAAAGLCGITLYYLFENIALTCTLASNVGVIISISPFFTVIFSCLFLKGERITARFIAGFVVAVSGILLISFGNGGDLQLNPLGDILAAAAAVIWAAYAAITKKISSFGYNTIQTTRRTFFYGLVFMIPAAVFTDTAVSFQDFHNPAVILNLLFLGLGASALCFVTWNSAVKVLGAVKTSVYIYMVPVITAVTSALVLHERMTPAAVCGILLTLAGLLLSENRKGRGEPALGKTDSAHLPQ